MDYLNQVEQEAEALQGLYNLSESEEGKLLIDRQKLKVKSAFEVLLDKNIKFVDKEHALNILLVNLDLLKELTDVFDNLKLLEESLDIELSDDKDNQ